jgi:hypothetical protein
MNRSLIDLLRRIEEGSRRLSATIVHNQDKAVRDIELARADIAEITNAFAEFKAQVAAGASVGYIGGRLIKKDGN